MKKTIEEARIETDKTIGQLKSVAQKLECAKNSQTIHHCLEELRTLVKGKTQLKVAVRDFELHDCTRTQLINIIEQTCKRLSKRCYNMH